MPTCSHSFETLGGIRPQLSPPRKFKKCAIPSGSTSHANVDRRRTDIPFKPRVMSKDIKDSGEPHLSSDEDMVVVHAKQQRKTPAHSRVFYRLLLSLFFCSAFWSFSARSNWPTLRISSNFIRPKKQLSSVRRI